MINYDVNIDYKIIDTIYGSQKKSCNHSELRNKVHSAPYALDKHLDNLERWGLIKNNPPKSVGHGRVIELKNSVHYAIGTLSRLELAIKTVNEFFTDKNTNQQE